MHHDKCGAAGQARCDLIFREISAMAQFSASDSLAHRRIMVDGQIRTYGITDLDLIDRFLAVPRENFVGPEQVALAWSDAAVQLQGGRTLLKPMVLAKMLQAASLLPGDRVLDIAGGSGYGAALMAGLATQIVALEAGAGQAAAIAANCAALGLANVEAVSGDLTRGAPGKAPFDVIMVEGAVETGLEPLLAQLANKGRLIVIRNKPGRVYGEVMRCERHGASIGERVLFEAAVQVLAGFGAAPAFAF